MWLLAAVATLSGRITNSVTSSVTDRVTTRVTSRVTDRVTTRVTNSVTSRVTRLRTRLRTVLGATEQLAVHLRPVRVRARRCSCTCGRCAGGNKNLAARRGRGAVGTRGGDHGESNGDGRGVV